MFDAPFSHWLSYGATDQQTITEMQGLYDGLLVPGTVAAFQHQGTGGFVLALSATVEGSPYVIDPRFPLFQQALPEPKRSHSALADILGVPGLIRDDDPRAEDFTGDIVKVVAERWLAFNETYQGSAGQKFDKYAQRLGQPLDIGDAHGPTHVLAPYLVASGVADPWWEVSKALFEATTEASNEVSVIRVVAATEANALGELLLDCPAEPLVIWVSGLNAIDSDASDLSAYLEAVKNSTAAGQTPFALYGGFFSVIAASVGLVGSAHGIGYGEYRAWPELPRSGPPPARYYLRQIHRYVSQEDAQRLWMADRELAACDCSQCSGRSPIELEYHDLMKHSVESRAAEIAEFNPLPLDQILVRLEAELEDFLDRLTGDNVGQLLWSRMGRGSRHMSQWILAIKRFVGGS